LDDIAGFVVNLTFSGEYFEEAHPPDNRSVNEKIAIRNRLILLNFIDRDIIPVIDSNCKNNDFPLKRMFNLNILACAKRLLMYPSPAGRGGDGGGVKG